MPKPAPPPTRLPAQPGELIDRGEMFPFSFDGKQYFAYPGDTIASALAAGGVTIFSRSFKYHRPRGLLCAAGHCANCLVQVEEEPNVRACTRAVQPGMRVTHQNAWPTLQHDIMSLTQLAAPLLPVGFYYKTFIHPRFLWPAYESVLRHAAGLGKLDLAASAGPPHFKHYLHADVAVVGGGRSGVLAATAAASLGARVLLFDDQPTLGGRLRYQAARQPQARGDLLAQMARFPEISVYLDAAVIGWWEDNWLAAVQGDDLYKIRARAVVIATGAYEQPLPFAHNDLPGVMLGSAAQRLIHLYGVRPGSQALIVTSTDEGWAVAADLLAAGVTVAAVADSRAGSNSPLVDTIAAASAQRLWSHTIVRAEGDKRVRRGHLAPLTAAGQIDESATKQIDCDLILICGRWAPANGLLYQAGAGIAYDPSLDQYRVHTLPDGLFAAGRVTGGNSASAGHLAGLQAAAFAGFAAQAQIAAAQAEAAPSQPLPGLSAPAAPDPKQQILCFCEDVSTKDLQTAVAEGYDSIELLKRYTTLSMGPCQGKMCSANALHLCAQATGRSVAATGTTTARAPIPPTSLAALAGQPMEPAQRSPIDAWHRAHGARMMNAGLWLRPEHYGDPTAEALAVRQSVGLIDVSTLGKLQLSGPGVPALLDRLYVNSLPALAVGRGRYGLMCNDEGVILDDGVTARLDEQLWYTTTTSSGAGAIFEWMQWWAQSGWGQGVHIADVTESFAAFNLAGPQARAVLAKLTAADISNAAFPYMHVREIEIAQVACRVLRIGFTGELSYEIHCPAGWGLHVWAALLEAGSAFGIRPFGVEAQRVLRLEKGHIIIGQDTDALSDPMAAGMGWAVKLDKPDFLGKRSLARVAADGPKQRLVGFTLAEPGAPPEEGLQIVQINGSDRPQIIGWITSSRFSPTLNQAIGLCWLPAELAAQPGAAFTIWREGRPLSARVHHGPFYDPAGARLRA